MDRMEGLMKNLKLSDMESKGRKIIWGGGGKVGMVEPQAIAKLMSEKPAHAEAVANALARAWCPLKGLDCKDMGEHLLVHLSSTLGKRKAIEDGLGIWLGHIDKECGIKLKKGEDAQYRAWMKAFIPRISSDGYRSIRNEERSVWGGRSGRGGGNMSSGAYRSNSRSDSGSWRKNVTLAVKDGGQKNPVEEEVTSPLKEVPSGEKGTGNHDSSRKQLSFSTTTEIDGKTKDSKNGEAAGEKVDETDIVMLEQGGDSGKTQVEELRVEGQDKKEADESIPNNNITGKQGSKFKRQRKDGVKDGRKDGRSGQKGTRGTKTSC
ncbi:hypothetical protein ZWY2020_035186 [Hordeum vulgare]|nr:hypothetical protein ZWY2020_035186 [Hordeum vulgare]